MTYLLAFGAVAVVLGWSMRGRLARRRHARCLRNIERLEIGLGYREGPRRLRSPQEAAAYWHGYHDTASQLQAAQMKAANYSWGVASSQGQWAEAIRAIAREQVDPEPPLDVRRGSH